MPKRTLRQRMLTQRRALCCDEWLRSSRLAQQRLLALEEFTQANCVALYAAIHNEVDTELILEVALKAGKQVLYPAVCGYEMVLRQVEHLKQLSPGCFGILEPCRNGADYKADDADLIVVPGVAFDQNGHRIGYGKGFYDRFLQKPARTTGLIGLCHDFQLIAENIPADCHDIRVELVVTEKRIVHCGSNRRQDNGPNSHRGGY